MMKLHPLVRDLYKRAILVGRDYPHPRGLEYVRQEWKRALRDPANQVSELSLCPKETEKEIRKLVGRGRYAIREMEGLIQLKKYRTLRRRYGGGELDVNGETERIRTAAYELGQQKKLPRS